MVVLIIEKQGINYPKSFVVLKHHKSLNKHYVFHSVDLDLLKELDENSYDLSEVIKVNQSMITQLIDKNDKIALNPNLRFKEHEKIRCYTEIGSYHIGCDNSSGNCWVEEFSTKKECLSWLDSNESAENIREYFLKKYT